MMFTTNLARVLSSLLRGAAVLACIAGAGVEATAGPALPGAQGTGPSVKARENPGTSLASHRAVYDLSLIKVSQGDGVRAATGTMTYALTDRCDGYTIETNIAMNLAFANGSENQVEQRYAAWEAKDGRSSTFRFQVIENGALTKSYQGDIQFKDDGTGTATYETDQVVKFDLPRGTLLSTAHTLELIRSASARERFLSKLVIDGAFDEGPFWVTAAIAPPLEGPVSPAAGGLGALSEGRVWPIGMAYFPLSSSHEMPEYELNMNLLVSGITRSMVQDFGGFTLAFKPVRVEPIAGPPCL